VEAHGALVRLQLDAAAQALDDVLLFEQLLREAAVLVVCVWRAAKELPEAVVRARPVDDGLEVRDRALAALLDLRRMLRGRLGGCGRRGGGGGRA